MTLIITVCLMLSILCLMLAVIREDSTVNKSIRERLVAELTPNAPLKRSPVAQVLRSLAVAVPPPLTKWSEKTYGTALNLGWVGFGSAEFVILKVMIGVACAGALMAVMGVGHVNSSLLVVAILVGFFGPDLWLRQRIRARQLLIARDLPDVVDLLSLCVEAGIDFMGAMNRIVREFRASPLVDELGVMLREVKLGKRRRDALKAMAKRANVSDLNAFVRTIVQVDRMGTGIAEALRIQSEESRMRRQHIGERLAQQAPLKMLIPLVLFIMPAVLILVGGPVLLQFIRGDLLPASLMQTPQMSAAPQMPEPIHLPAGH